MELVCENFDCVNDSKQDVQCQFYQNYRRYNWNRERKNMLDNNSRSVKMKILSFCGKNDPEACHEWEKKMDLVFDCQNFFEHKNVRLTAFISLIMLLLGRIS